MSEATIEELLAHRDWLANLVRRLVKDPATADDIVQEACVTALSRPPGHQRSIRGWLATVARNLVTDTRRRLAREARRDQEAASSECTAPDTADVAARVEAEQEVARLVLRLPEPYRSTLLLRYWRGLSPAEIGRETGVPAGTVRSRLSRGHRLLRERLDRRHEGDRRAWVLALMPLSAREPAGGPATMSILVKLTAALLLATGAAVGTNQLLSDPKPAPMPTPATAENAVTLSAQAQDDPPEKPVAPEEQEPGKAEEDQGGNDPNSKPDPMEKRLTFSFAQVTLRQALSAVGRMGGLSFEVEPAAEDSMLTLYVKDVSVREAIDLLTKLAGCEWEQRADGVIVVRRNQSITVPKPPERETQPPPAEEEPPVAAPDPIYPAAPPTLEMSGEGDWNSVPNEVLHNALEIVIARNGKRCLRLLPNGTFEMPTTTYTFSLRISDLQALTPDPAGMSVLIRVDRNALPRHLRTLLYVLRRVSRPRGELWLANGGWPARPAGPKDGLPPLRQGAGFPFGGRAGHRNLRALGGGVETERDVDYGLRWLESSKETDGSWRSGGEQVETTALALMAFLGAGETRTRGRYKTTVRKGLEWLVSRQDDIGRIGPGSPGKTTIGHVAATIVLAESYAQSSRDAKTRVPAQKAVDYLQTCDQNFASTHALTIARLAGLRVDVSRLTAAVRSIGDASPQEHAIGTLDRILIGDTPDYAKCSKELLRHAPSTAGDGGMLLWLAAGDAAFQIGGATWKTWNQAMQETLFARIRLGRAEVGSFDPVGPVATEGGRVISTALAVLCLQTYYRYERVREFK